MSNHPNLAAHIRAQLEAAGVTQERAAEALLIPQTSISRRFRGITPWRADELLALSLRFNVPLEALYGPPAVHRPDLAQTSAPRAS